MRPIGAAPRAWSPRNHPPAPTRCRCRITEYLPGYVHKLHVHPVQDEIIFVLEGKGASETATGKREIGPGDVVLVPAGVHHATYNPNSEVLRAIIIKSPPDSK